MSEFKTLEELAANRDFYRRGYRDVLGEFLEKWGHQSAKRSASTAELDELRAFKKRQDIIKIVREELAVPLSKFYRDGAFAKLPEDGLSKLQALVQPIMDALGVYTGHKKVILTHLTNAEANMPQISIAGEQTNFHPSQASYCAYLSQTGFGSEQSKEELRLERSNFPLVYCGGGTQLMIRIQEPIQLPGNKKFWDALEAKGIVEPNTYDAMKWEFDHYGPANMSEEEREERLDVFRKLAQLSCWEQARSMLERNASLMGAETDYSGVKDFRNYILLPGIFNGDMYWWVQLHQVMDEDTLRRNLSRFENQSVDENPVFAQLKNHRLGDFYSGELLHFAEEVVASIADIFTVQARASVLFDANEQLKVAVAEKEAAYVDLKEAQAINIKTAERAARAEQTEVLAGQMAHEVRGELSPQRNLIDAIRIRVPGGEAVAELEHLIIHAYKSSSDEGQKKNLVGAAKFIKYIQNGELSNRLEAMDDGIDRVSSLVEGVMDYARLGSELAITGEEININSVINDLVSNYESKVIYEPTIYNSISISGSSLRLRQALRNIVQNAIEATEEKKGKYRAPMIGLDVEDNKVIISVKDFGSGMNLEQQQRLFAPMYTTKPTSGHGLGLAITQRIIEAYGGHIEVESSEGKGSEFKIVFPYSVD